MLIPITSQYCNERRELLVNISETLVCMYLNFKYQNITELIHFTHVGGVAASRPILFLIEYVYIQQVHNMAVCKLINLVPFIQHL